MYIPSSFRETDPETIAAFLRENGFGTLVTVRDGEPRVSHLPFLFEPQEGERGILYSHVARANDHWKEGSGNALAIFTGPHHYISPTWYGDAETVPTWSYVTVHARGAVEWLDGEEAKRDVLERMVTFYEARLPEPWAADFGAAYVGEEMRAIVPLRIEVRSLDGKWKLNQHHPLERQERTARALRKLPSEDAQAIASLMEANVRAKRGAESPAVNPREPTP